MKMKSARLGRGTSAVEVTNVSRTGFWLLLDGRELFLPFTQFPWFEDVTIGQLANVQRPRPDHLYWPTLDVDLSVESIEHPERFPLVSRRRPNNAMRLPGRGSRPLQRRLRPASPRRSARKGRAATPRS